MVVQVEAASIAPLEPAENYEHVPRRLRGRDGLIRPWPRGQAKPPYAMKEQVRQLNEEVTVLRERLARQLGEDADLARGQATRPMLDQLEDRAAELEADNHALRQRITRLEGELAELTETLAAARSMNRELMTQLNSDAGGAIAGNRGTPRRKAN